MAGLEQWRHTATWRHDSGEIYFVTPAPQNTVMAAAVVPQESGFAVGAVTPLFSVRPPGMLANSYQAAANGQRFLVNMGPALPATAAPITVVVNWTAELRR